MIRKMVEIVVEAAKGTPCMMAVAVAQDEDVLRGVEIATKYGIIRPILVGNKAEIIRIAAQGSIDIGDYEIIDEPEKAAACMAAAAMVRDKKATLLMKGFVDTALIMKAVLNKDMGLKKSSLVSHIVLMEIPGYDRLFYITDAAMNIAPNFENKVAIIENAVKVAHALGNECPKVAVLCAVEKVNGKMPCTLDAQALTEMNERGEIKGCLVKGPLATDNAVSAVAAKHKGIIHPVAGNADILLAPNIEAANILEKSIEYFANPKKAGIMMGTKMPIVLTSRASEMRSKLNSIALGALIGRR